MSCCLKYEDMLQLQGCLETEGELSSLLHSYSFETCVFVCVYLNDFFLSTILFPLKFA